MSTKETSRPHPRCQPTPCACRGQSAGEQACLGSDSGAWSTLWRGPRLCRRPPCVGWRGADGHIFPLGRRGELRGLEEVRAHRSSSGRLVEGRGLTLEAAGTFASPRAVATCGRALPGSDQPPAGHWEPPPRFPQHSPLPDGRWACGWLGQAQPPTRSSGINLANFSWSEHTFGSGF